MDNDLTRIVSIADVTEEDFAILLHRVERSATVAADDFSDMLLFDVMAEEQATSEVPRAERMRAYAFIGLGPEDMRG